MLLLAVLTVKIGVFGLFHPTKLIVEAPRSQVLLFNGTPLVSREIRTGEPVTHVAARNGGDTEFVLNIPGKIRRTFYGTLEVVTVDGELVSIVTMDREQAVAAVVAAEYPSNPPLEAL